MSADESMDETISLEARCALIKATPAFSILASSQIKELAELFEEKQFSTGDIIMKENDFIDSIYLIVQGKAEVSHEFLEKKKKVQVPLAILSQGETIGLNDTGFFSSSGKRTATVHALTPMVLLSLSIKNLHEFLRRHKELQSKMFSFTSQILKFYLIKQSLPFHQLSNERIIALADKVKEITIPKGQEIFKKGDSGNECYLIAKGQVEIFTPEGEDEESKVSTLSAPTMFGEATLITQSKRNASARALEDCELLVLRYEYLSELIENEENVAKMFMTLMLDRSKPLKNPSVSMHPRTTLDGQEITILKNPMNGRYFKLSDQGQFIWEQLNGNRSMQEITLAFADKFDMFAPDLVAALISKLSHAGFIDNVEINTIPSHQPLWVRVVTKVKKVLEARIAFGDSDKWVTSLYQKGIYFFFKRIVQFVLGLFALSGFVAFIFSTTHTIQIFKTMPDTWILLLCLIPATLLQKTLHELGHAFATKSFGYEVHYMGIGWYWLSPVAFTDTSDMWLSTRGPRIVVNLAGVYTDVILGGIASILVFIIPNAYVQGFLWIFALYVYISAFRMMSPLQELDGYYVLMDMLDRPNLRQSAVVWLAKGFPKALKEPTLFKNNLPEVFYWLACLVFLISVVGLTLFLQGFVFKILNIHSSNIFISLALPFLVVLISSLTIIAEIRSST